MERSAANLGIALLISLVLVIVAFGVILLGWRSAVVGLAAILSSFSVALLVLVLRGTTINTMVLAGLVMALAIVIDDAVIVLDNAARRLHRQRFERCRADGDDGRHRGVAGDAERGAVRNLDHAGGRRSAPLPAG
jgi:Cu/Ag efflux pump CusA